MSTYSKIFRKERTPIRAFVKLDGKTNWFSVASVDVEQGLVYFGANKILFQISAVIEWEII